MLKVRITSSLTEGRERVLRGRILRVLQKGFVDLKKGDTISLHSNTTCNCPQVNRLDMDYLVAGHEDMRQRQSRLYLFSTNGVVEAWERAWVGKFRKWEKRLESKRLGRNNNRKNRKRRRKGGVHIFRILSLFLECLVLHMRNVKCPITRLVEMTCQFSITAINLFASGRSRIQK